MNTGLRSSQQQLKDEFYALYKKMTDPEERAKEKEEKRLKEYKNKRKNQFGL